MLVMAWRALLLGLIGYAGNAGGVTSPPTGASALGPGGVGAALGPTVGLGALGSPGLSPLPGVWGGSWSPGETKGGGSPGHGLAQLLAHLGTLGAPLALLGTLGPSLGPALGASILGGGLWLWSGQGTLWGWDFVELAAAAPLALLVLSSHGSLRRPPAWALLAPLAAFALAPGGSVHHPEKAQGAYGGPWSTYRRAPNPGL
jgi:hypothetical protein